MYSLNNASNSKFKTDKVKKMSIKPARKNRQLHNSKGIFIWVYYYIYIDSSSVELSRLRSSFAPPPPPPAGGDGWGIPYNGLYRDAPPERGTCFRLQLYKKFIPRV